MSRSTSRRARSTKRGSESSARFPASPCAARDGLHARRRATITSRPVDDGERRLVLYIGSSIGNFEPREAALLLRRMRAGLSTGDGLLLGVDLVKDEATLLAAYDDAAGVTAAFNRNILVRLNRELDADFDLESFEHRAVWNAGKSRIRCTSQAAAPTGSTRGTQSCGEFRLR